MLFCQVEAYDPDIKDRNAPQNIVYSLVKHEQKEFLQIDNDGCLRLTKPLDRDQPLGFTRWQILIMAADQGGRLGSDSLRSTTEVILELTDINDNAPFLTNVSTSILFCFFCFIFINRLESFKSEPTVLKWNQYSNDSRGYAATATLNANHSL